MRKLILSLFVLSAILFSAQTSYAAPFGRAISKEIKQEIKQEVKERNQSLFDRVKNLVRKNLRFNARITGTIAVIGDSSMTVTGADGKTYQVAVTGETKLVRRFGGASTLSEFAVGNLVHVFGKFTNDEQTSVDARLIRNASIQIRWGAFFGEVTAKNSDNFVIESLNRGSQTVYFTGAKFVNVSEEEISYADVAVGHRVRVKGIWDNSTNAITEVDQVKDFSL